MIKRAWTAGLTALATAGLALAQTPSAPLPRVDTDEGFALFQQKGFSCHGAAGAVGAPNPETLRSMGPERVYAALTTGPMKALGDTLSESDRKLVSAAVGGALAGRTGHSVVAAGVGFGKMAQQRGRGPAAPGPRPILLRRRRSGRRRSAG